MFGNIIKKLREKKGYSQKEVANSIGVSAAALSKLENDKTLPLRQTKIALAKFYNDNLGDAELDKELIGNQVIPSKKEIIEETPIEEIFSLKFGGGTTRRSKEELIKLRKLVERKTQEMLNE